MREHKQTHPRVPAGTTRGHDELEMMVEMHMYYKVLTLIEVCLFITRSLGLILAIAA